MKDSNFFLQVYDVCQLIPEGKVTTYGAIEKYLSSPQSSKWWDGHLINVQKIFLHIE